MRYCLRSGGRGCLSGEVGLQGAGAEGVASAFVMVGITAWGDLGGEPCGRDWGCWWHGGGKKGLDCEASSMFGLFSNDIWMVL